MAFQNRIDFLVEILKGLTNRVAKIENSGLKIFNNQVTLFNQLNDLSKNNITLIQKIPDVNFTPGFPGSQKEVLTEKSNLIANLITNINSIENETNKDIESIKQEYSDSTVVMNEYLSDLCQNAHQIDSIKFSINANVNCLPAKLSKYQKSVKNIVTQKTKIKKKSEITHIYEKILKIRKDSIFKRSDFVPPAEKCMTLISENSTNSVELLKKHFLFHKDILSAVIKSNNEIIQNFEECSENLSILMNKIDFQDDFKKFTSFHQIIRYDLLPDPFKPLDLHHDCFENLTKVSNVLSLQLYPYSMARMKYDFIAEDRNELSVQKGKIVLIMEDLSLEWTFAQNPYTKMMGYVPSSYLEEIGKGLGVLLHEFDATEEILNKGDYVSIEDSDENGSYRIHTITNNIFEIPMSFIGIISEVENE